MGLTTNIIRRVCGALVGLAGAAVILLGGVGQPAFGSDRFITMGTGAVNGVYYPTGNAICRILNQNRVRHLLSCSVQTTPGSVYNIENLRFGGLDLAIAQSDLQYEAYRGKGIFSKLGIYRDLRAVLSLHEEPFTLVARGDAGITRLQDLPGKRINIGLRGSGQRANLQSLFEAAGWTKKDFAEIHEIDPADQGLALCAGEIDVTPFTVGHPASAIVEATRDCGAVLVNVDGPIVDKLLRKNPAFGPQVIAGGIYPNNPGDINTFGGRATLVTTVQTSEPVIYTLVKSLFGDLDRLKDAHTALRSLRVGTMLQDGLSIPLHRGATRFYLEQGWLDCDRKKSGGGLLLVGAPCGH